MTSTERSRLWRQKNHDRYVKSSKLYREKNKEKLSNYFHNRYLEKKAQKAQYDKEYRSTNKIRISGVKRLGYLKKVCYEIQNVENYEDALKDNYVGWQLHHRLESHFSDGTLRTTFLTRKELELLEVYFNRPACELIFLKTKDHVSLHHKERKKKYGSIHRTRKEKQL